MIAAAVKTSALDKSQRIIDGHEDEWDLDASGEIYYDVQSCCISQIKSMSIIQKCLANCRQRQYMAFTMYDFARSRNQVAVKSNSLLVMISTTASCKWKRDCQLNEIFDTSQRFGFYSLYIFSGILKLSDSSQKPKYHCNALANQANRSVSYIR